ncbi:MAG TPA: tetratricopeptide repeat protein [Chthoniobacterales bacterium]|nr:tetratricopeptide repeat protein [Chthoniobacterales bacterium]
MKQQSSTARSLRSLPVGGYIFVGVFFVRLLVLFRLTGSPFLLPAQGDMHFYHDWAQRILRGEWTDYRAFYGLPLYAYLLAGLYSLAGVNPFVPGVLQACLEAGTALILFKLGERIFRKPEPAAAELQPSTENSIPLLNSGTAIGLLAAIGWAFYLPAQSYSVILMPAAWLVFVFWFVVWQVLRRDEIPPARWFFFHGVLIGVTAMGIATVLFLLPLIVCAAAVRWKCDSVALGRLRIGTATVLLGAGFAMGTSPAWLHNRFVAGDPVFLSAHSGVNLWIGNNPSANGYPRFPPGLRAGQQAMLTDSITGAEAAAGRPLRRSEVSAFWSAKAKAFIAENPRAWAQLLAAKVANFWNSFQYDDISVVTSLREQGVTFPGFRFGVVAAFGLAGIVLAVPRFPASPWVLAAVLLHMLSLLSVFITERYRLAAVPGLLLFAAFAVYHLWQALTDARYSRVLACLALIVAASLLVSFRRTDAELWALDPYNSGLHALEAGRLDAAERKLKLAHAYVPSNAELNFALGNLEVVRGNIAAARSWYAQTLALNPRHEGVLNNLGVLALEEGRARDAIELFERGLEVEPQEAKTHYLLARAALELGDPERALAEVDVALRLDPDQPEFLELRRKIINARDTALPGKP